MDELEILSIMRSLSERRPSFKNEDDFHKELFNDIKTRLANNEGRTKVHIVTDRMPNKTRVEPDIVIDRFAIELKYVEVPKGRIPKDAPAQIPYDSIWDCAKLETLIDANEIDDGIVIALTNYEDYWVQRKRGGWARNFYLPDLSEWRSIDDPLMFTVMPSKAACKHPAIFKDDRFHVVLRHDWEYRWFHYYDTFRFIFLRRKGDTLNQTKIAEIDRWLNLSNENRLSSIPFLNGAVRKAAMDFRDRFVENYVQNPKGQARDCPICQRRLLNLPESID